MPDLQSELAKVLTQKQFDDEPDAPRAPPEVVGDTDHGNTRARFWSWLKKNPGSTIAQAEAAIGVEYLSASVGNLMQRGLLRREKLQAGAPFRYYAVGDEYKAMTPQESIQHALAAKFSKPKKRKVRADKGTIRGPRTSKPAPTKTLEEMKQALLPQPKAFNADEIIGQLNVMQARELLVRLKEVFGV